MGLDVYELMLEVEEEFDVRIADVEASGVQSVGDLYDVTLKALREQHPAAAGENPQLAEDVWRRLKALLVHQLGLQPEQVVKSARFFVELGFD